MKFEYPAGATPIDPEEATGLIPTHITLQRELNEYEEANILEATEWAFARRRGDPLDARPIQSARYDSLPESSRSSPPRGAYACELRDGCDRA